MLQPIPFKFTTTTRAETPDAPPFDPTKNEKYWSDPSPVAGPDGQVTYSVVAPGGNNGFTTIKMSSAEATALNMIGHPDYPAPTPPLEATFNNGNSRIAVCEKADAIALAEKMGVDASTIADAFATILPSISLTYPASNPNARAWEITVGGVAVQVTALLAQMNANGVGSPGHWDGIVWVSDLASPNAVSPLTPVPVDMSKVPAGSTVQVNQMTGIAMLNVPDAPAPVATGGSIDLSTDPTAQAILAGVTALRGVFHV